MQMQSVKIFVFSFKEAPLALLKKWVQDCEFLKLLPAHEAFYDFFISEL